MTETKLISLKEQAKDGVRVLISNKLRARFVYLLLSALISSTLVRCLAKEPCDAELLNAGDPDGYRPRGDRCEGFFDKNIEESTSLTLVSFSQIFETFSIDPKKTLTIEWTPPAMQAVGMVHIRAVGIGYRLYYRMDAERPVLNPFYMWPLDSLSSAMKRRPFQDGFGILGWVDRFPMGPPSEVYLPLRIHQTQSPAQGDQLRAVFITSVALDNVYYSVFSFDQGSGTETLCIKRATLMKEYYDAGDKVEIAIPLTTLAKPGIFHLLVTASPSLDETPISGQLWFFN